MTKSELKDIIFECILENTNDEVIQENVVAKIIVSILLAPFVLLLGIIMAGFIMVQKYNIEFEKDQKAWKKFLDKNPKVIKALLGFAKAVQNAAMKTNSKYKKYFEKESLDTKNISCYNEKKDKDNSKVYINTLSIDIASIFQDITKEDIEGYANEIGMEKALKEVKNNDKYRGMSDEEIKKDIENTIGWGEYVSLSSIPIPNNVKEVIKLASEDLKNSANAIKDCLNSMTNSNAISISVEEKQYDFSDIYDYGTNAYLRVEIKYVDFKKIKMSDEVKASVQKVIEKNK